MDDQNVTLDMSKAQPLPGQQDGGGGVTLDMSKAQPLPTTTPEEKPQAAVPDSLHLGGDPTTLSGGLHNIAAGINSVGASIGSEIMDTVGGAIDMAHKVDQKFGINPSIQHAEQTASNYVHGKQNELEQQNRENPTLNMIGKGSELIAEFMMGEPALKGLSFADKFSTVAKFMKIAEKSPKLMDALHFGIAAGKTATELSPEEAAILKQSPKLAKLFGLGASAARAGAIQGVQTTVKTGGDVGHGAADALLTGAVTGGVGAALGGAAHVLGKGRQAAQTIQEMTEAAQHAPSPAAVEEQLGNTVHGAFNNEKGVLQNNLDDATSTIGMFGEGAPQQSDITKSAQQFASTGRKNVSGAYQKGLNDLVEMAGDKTVPFEGSPLHKTAQELAKAGEANAGPLDEAFNIERPGSTKANRIIDRLANFGKKEIAEAEPDKWVDHEGVTHIEEPHIGMEGETTPPAESKMSHLVDYRQKIAKFLRDTDGSTAEGKSDKEIYQKLLKATDETIGNLADTVGSEASAVPGEEAPSAGRKLFDKMNEAYRQGIQPFSNRDVRNVLNGNLNDVAKSIMGGQTSLADIQAVKQAVGPKNFEQIGKSSLQSIVQKFVDQATGEVDYKKLFQNFNRINPDVREAMFGGQGSNLADALKVANNSAGGLRAIDSHIQELLGSGKIDSLLKNPQQAKAIANAVGPDGMKALGQSIVQSEISKAATALDPKTGEIVKGRFDPQKVLDWWSSMKDAPEVRDAFFTSDKESAAHYNEMMAKLSQAAGVKKLIQYGVVPAVAGAAGAASLGPLAGLGLALAGGGAEAGISRFRDVLDYAANHPNTWKALSGVGKAAEAVASSPAAKTARDVVSAKTVEAATSDDPPQPRNTTNPNQGSSSVPAASQPKTPEPTYITPSFASGKVPGLVKPGNIDLGRRKDIVNPDGSHSSVFSMSFGNDDGEVLVPGVGDGTTYPYRKLTTKEALSQYRKTGKNFGTFKNPVQADKYGETLHEDQAKMKVVNGWLVSQ